MSLDKLIPTPLSRGSSLQRAPEKAACCIWYPIYWLGELLGLKSECVMSHSCMNLIQRQCCTKDFELYSMSFELDYNAAWKDTLGCLSVADVFSFCCRPSTPSNTCQNLSTIGLRLRLLLKALQQNLKGLRPYSRVLRGLGPQQTAQGESPAQKARCTTCKQLLQARQPASQLQ